MAGVAAADLPDTFPALLMHNAATRGERPAYREKEFGIWRTWTWREVRDQVRAIACGLAARGLRAGDKLAIVGDNRPELYWSFTAAQCLGAVPVPVYQDSVADELGYVLAHAEVRFAIAEDQEQVDKLIAIKERCPTLERVVYEDPRGLRNYRQTFLESLAGLMEAGRAFDAGRPGFFDEAAAKVRPDDVCVILYTSGTTGRPKGVMLTHRNKIETARSAVAFDNLTEREEIVSYLPMAWVGDHTFSYAQHFVAGFCVNCPESGATVMTDLREIGPTYFFAPPRIWETILTNVSIRMEDAGWLKRALYRVFMADAKRVGPWIMDGAPVPLLARLFYRLGEWLVFGPLKNALGLSRVRLAFTAGEAVGPDTFDFYRSIGLRIKQLYGMTETCVPTFVQPDDRIRPDTVGVAIPGVEARIADNGEILIRGPGVLAGYYRNEEATRETKSPDGWVRTGDAGFYDAEGQLKIIDRARDVGRLRNGTLFAPKYIENKLKFFPEIREAVAFGDGHDYVAALVNIDLQAVGHWAERRGMPYGSYQELAAKPEVYDLVAHCVARVNADLAADNALKGSQIQRFLVLHKELDADDGELTRTRKVRRTAVAERYRPLVDALYSLADRARIETDVTFEDGRTGRVKADLAIRTLPLVDAVQQAAE
jgi:long-chain acyl-CoA synthetase